MLHENLRLYVSNEAYTLVADSEKPETLVITRASNEVSVLASKAVPGHFDQELAVYGVFGIVTLLKSDYLVVITNRNKVATVLTTPVYAATNFSVFPVDRAGNPSLLAQPDEAYLLGLLKTHLFSAPFYFTYGGYNVTNRLQEQKSAGAFWETCDDRFFWNRHLQSRLIDVTARDPAQDSSRFVLPVMFGFLNIKSATINSRDVLFGLISRRSRFRAGTRYFSRGIDQEGNVSNFNETEQICLLDGVGGGAQAGGPITGNIQFSYVQTRGSVPVYWAEVNNLRYKPDLKIMDLSSTAESLSRHFDQQVSLYGDQYLVNLVNKSGYEKPVKEAYERALDAMANPRVHYTYFDFHHECKGLRFDRVSVLIDSLDEELHTQGYFFKDTSATSTQAQIKQTSVVRSNCMDCLDRTNVVQSALGKWVLNNQLRQIGVLSIKESIEDHADFLHLFRNIWADNADVVSRAYSGTGALKTDYTRTGKRSKEGALQDGVNSVMRYIKNNFLDGPRQDAYDLVTGAWTPRKGQELTWRQDSRDALTQFAPTLLAIAAFFLTAAIMFPASIATYVSTRRVILISLLFAVFAFMHVINNGVSYVSWPKLVVLTTSDYNGKGFESGRHGRPIRSQRLEAPVRAAPSAKKESLLPTLSTSKRD